MHLPKGTNLTWAFREPVDERSTNHTFDLFVLENFKHSQAQTLTWTVSRLSGAAAALHSVISSFPLFFLHLVSCVPGGEFFCCCKGGKHVVTPASCMSLAGLTGVGVCIYMCTKSSVTHQYSTHVLERGNPAWLDRATPDSFSICLVN